MRRRWKILIGIGLGLAALLILNTVVVNNQTKEASTTVDGAQIVDAFGGEVQVTDTGPRDAPPMVLIHCYTCSLRWWDAIEPELAEHRRVVRVDLLGHGGSQKPATGYSIEEQASTVASVLSSLGISGATVVGHSLGFTVATSLAEQSPDLVARLADLDQAPDNDYGELPLEARLGYVPVLGQAIWRTVPDFQIRDGLKEAFAPGYNLASGFEDPDQVVTDFKSMTYRSFKESAKAEEDFTDETPLNERVAELGIPLLVVFGDEDQLYDDPQEAAEGFGDVPGVQTTIVEGAGHSPNVEKPNETAALLLEFSANPGDEHQSPLEPEFVPPNKKKAPNKKKQTGN